MDGKKAAKRKNQHPLEVEMVDTAEYFNKSGGGGNESSNENLAQPKGVRTRAAVAKHLALKLNHHW